MRWLLMSMALWSVCGWAQVQSSGTEAARVQQLQLLGGVTERERLRVEVVLAYVLDVDRLGRQSLGGGGGAPAGGGGAESLLTVHRALDVLGAPLLRYNLVVSDHVEVLFCQSATVYSDQRCWHDEWDRPVGMGDWFARLHTLPGARYRDGTAVLYAVHLPHGFAWTGARSGGEERHYRYRDERWYEVHCRAWALADTTAIAHELGHCFGLADNDETGEDANGRLDLMRPDYGHEDWLNEANRSRVAAFFREEDRWR